MNLKSVRSEENIKEKKIINYKAMRLSVTIISSLINQI